MLKLYIYIYIYIVLRSRLSCLEEKHDSFKHHTRDEFIEINKTFCDIKDVLSKKSIEEDLKSITDNMDLLFNMIDKEMERKYAGKGLLYLHGYLHVCRVFWESRYLDFLYKNTYIQSF